MMNWEIVKCLIDAKKDIDSLMFIEMNLNKIPKVLRKEYVDRVKDNFYINCCAVVDAFLDQRHIYGKQRTEWKEKHLLIKQLYYERDKNSAHIDEGYRFKNYDSFQQIITEMKKQIYEVKRNCEEILPSIIELNFFPHDKILLRLINMVDEDKEEMIKRSKYTDHKEGFAVGDLMQPRKVVYDIKELRGLCEEEKKDLAVLVEAGLNFYEAQQNLQDFFIIVNCIHGLNLWTSNVEERICAYERLKRSGIIDQFDRPKKTRVITDEFKEWAYNTANFVWGYGLWDYKN